MTVRFRQHYNVDKESFVIYTIRMTTATHIQKRLSLLPDNPGIYLFYNVEKELVYVGKATSLRSRVRSYFRGMKSPRPIEEMIHEVVNIKWETTDSVLEAVILESVYIKKFLPKYNVLGKDNKSWNYIVITNDTFPKVVTMRQHEYAILKANKQGKQIKQSKFRRNRITDISQIKQLFGPYPGLNTTAAMKLLRQLFRFTNCEPPTKRKGSFASTQDDKPVTRPCLYYQMGQCIGVCAGDISASEYTKQVIKPLSLFLSGKKKQVVKMLEADMKRFGKEEYYEAAARVRDQLSALYHIQDIALLNKSFVMDVLPEHQGDLSRLRSRPLAEHPDEEIMGGRSLARVQLPEVWRGGAYGENGKIRIEGYDISNTGATEKVASMVVFNEFGPVKNQYRKFIVKNVVGQSDVDSLAEVITRRLNHVEWPLPTVFLIDGGRPQVNKVLGVLSTKKVVVPVVGIAKGPERKRNDFILGNKDPEFILWIEAHKQLLIQARDEAHRFAITFHRQRRGKKFIV